MLSYNGVQMDLMTINEMTRDAVMSPDGTDYLYTHFLGDVTCFVHNSYLSSVIAPELINPGYENFVTTDRQIRALLLVPRRKLLWDFETGGEPLAGALPAQGEQAFAPGGNLELPNLNPFIFRGPLPVEINNALFMPGRAGDPGQGLLDGSRVDVGDPPVLAAPNNQGQPQPGLINVGDEESVVYLESPLAGYDVDARNGPMPLECSVQKVVGVNGFLVNWRFETWVNECQSLNLSNASALLSNRWTMIYDVDDDYNTVRRVEGLAIFRTDAVRFQRISPDDLRKQMFLPIPRAFKRGNINVQGSSDNTSVRYSYTDVQTPVVFLAPGPRAFDINNPPPPNPLLDEPSWATRIEVRRQVVKFLRSDVLSSILDGVNSFYQYKINRKWAQDEQGAQRPIRGPFDASPPQPPPGGGGGGGGSPRGEPKSPSVKQVPQKQVAGPRRTLAPEIFDPAKKVRR